MNPNSIVGAQDAITRKMGVGIVGTLSKKGTLYWLTKVLEETKGIRKPHEVALRKSASRQLSKAEQAEYLLQGLPEMGPVSSKEIRSKYPNIMQFLNHICMYNIRVHGSKPYDDNDFKLSTRVFNMFPKWKEILVEKW